MPSFDAPNSGSMSLQLKTSQTQNIKQLQRLIMSRQMQQAIHLLQVPVMELTTLVDMEMEKNPVLEYSQDDSDDDSDIKQLEERSEEDKGEDEEDFEGILSFDDNNFEILRRLDQDFRDHFSESGSSPVKRTKDDEELQTYLEASIQAKESFFEHLSIQAKEAFKNEKELSISEAIIGSLDESGFLSSPLKEVAMLQGCTLEQLEAVLKVVQTFDPPGVAACNLQNSLLTQLKSLGKENTLSYTIIDKHFDDLIHNRISIIQKATSSTSDALRRCIDEEIAKLDLHPRSKLNEDIVSYAIPDIVIRQEEDELITAVNEDLQPELRLNSKYLRMLSDETLPEETKDFIKQKVLSAKWLMKNIMKRNSTLELIGKYLAKHQRNFFLEPKGNLVPLTMKAVADEIEVHESTVARAVSNKYIDCPKGILPLRAFFTSALETKDGEDISSQTVKDTLKKLIDKEDKHHPLSDEALSKMIKAEGISCARRTVAKYRGILKLGTAQQRRKA